MPRVLRNHAKITIDLGPAVRQEGGIGRYAGELSRALLALPPDHALQLFYSDSFRRRPAPPLDRLTCRVLPWSTKVWRTAVLASDFAGIQMDNLVGQTDLFHATEHLLPPLKRARTVFTLHDLCYIKYPDTHLARNRWYLGTMVPRFLRRADAVICVSEHTKRDAIACYSLDPNKIHVIPEGVSPSFRPIADRSVLDAVLARYRLPARFILYVGSIEPRKNLSVLLAAYERLHSGTEDVPPLVIVGSRAWKAASFLQSVAKSPQRRHIVLARDVADEDLPLIYNAAVLFVYPSLYEGFGLPPLEAMACGVPVVCANAASLPEVVGDAALLVDPRDVSALATAIRSFLEDALLRTSMVNKGLERAKMFSWDVAARRTSQLYSLVLGARRQFDPRMPLS